MAVNSILVSLSCAGVGGLLHAFISLAYCAENKEIKIIALFMLVRAATIELSAWLTANTAMHLTRHRRITEPSKRLSPSACCEQVMASVIRIHKAVNQGPRMVLSGSTMDG